MDALGQNVFAAAGLTGQQHGGCEFADPFGKFQHPAGLGVFTDHVFKAVLGHKAALVQLPAHLAVHLDQALAFLEGQHGTFDLVVHKDGRNIDHNGLVADVQQEGVGLLSAHQCIVQNALVQVGQHLGDGAAQQSRGGALQQVVADAVHPADDALLIDLNDAAEGVVQQGVDLGTVPLFQIDGVGHAGGNGQCIAQALLPGGDELVGQVLPLGALTHDVAADDGVAAIGKGMLHGVGQLVVLLHHIKVQVDAEQPVEPGGVAEHIGKADQADARAGQIQLLLQVQHRVGKLLLGDADLHQRQLDGALDGAGLHAAGNDQVAALMLQLPGALGHLIRPDVFNGHDGNGGKFADQGLCDGTEFLIGDQNCDLCHKGTSPCFGICL